MKKITYIADPLCGWCWASAPLADQLHLLAQQNLIEFEVLHRALFTGDMMRWMSNSFSDYVVQADSRIESLSGQTFSTAYRENLLYNSSLIFDSWPTATALQVIRRHNGTQAYDFIRTLQTARFEQGEIISDASVLTRVAASLGINAADFHKDFVYDGAITQAARDEQQAAIQLQNAVLSQGIPCFVLQDDRGISRLQHESFLGQPEAFAQEVKALIR